MRTQTACSNHFHRVINQKNMYVHDLCLLSTQAYLLIREAEHAEDGFEELDIGVSEQ